MESSLAVRGCSMVVPESGWGWVARGQKVKSHFVDLEVKVIHAQNQLHRTSIKQKHNVFCFIK